MCKNSPGEQAGGESSRDGRCNAAGGGAAAQDTATAAPKRPGDGTLVRREGVGVDRPFDSGIVVDTADDGAGVVIIPPRGADPMRATVFAVASFCLVGWTGLTLDPTVTAWAARLHAAAIGTRLFGLLQLGVLVCCGAALWWGWGSLLVTMFGEEVVTIGPHEVTYRRGALGITRTRRWGTNHVSTFRYRPSSRLNQWARGVGAEVHLYSSTGDISLAPGVIGLEARWLAAQLNELLSRQRPSQFTRVADGFD